MAHIPSLPLGVGGWSGWLCWTLWCDLPVPLCCDRPHCLLPCPVTIKAEFPTPVALPG